MDNFQLVIGDEACPIHHVLPIIGADTIISDKWSDFARELGIPSSKIKKLRKDILLDKIELSDAISEVTEEWVTRSGSKATLKTLLVVLEDKCGSNAVGELLRLRFNLPCRRNKVLLEWKELSPAFQQRVNQNLKHFFPDVEFSQILPKLEGPLLDDLMMEKKPSIFKPTLPEKMSYYIPRTLITRHFISGTIFDDYSADIFLFTGMDRYELSKLAKDKLTSTTKEQLRGVDVNSKFITLDHANHFDKICKKTPNPVHLLRRESDGRLKWIRSKGKLGNLRKHTDVKQDELDEVEFCKRVDTQSKAVIISDSPGMGKSVLLGEIGRHLIEVYPDKTVFFIVLSEYITLVRKLGTESTNLPEVITRALKASICESVLGEFVLPLELHSDEDSISVEMLLDGLDEVTSSDSQFALEVLRTIRNSFKSVRFWVTSRPHLLEHLEDNLSSLSYNIQSFNQDSQVQFLSSYWQRRPSVKIDQVRSVEFAEHCLLSLKSTLTSSDKDIAGVPLQCLLIGQIYEEEAVEYAGLDNEPLAAIEVEVGTIANLYRLLVQKKFQKYVTAYPGTRLDIPDLMAIHVRLSLKLLFPESFETLGEIIAPAEEDRVPLVEVLNVGILELSSTAVSPRFLHRTFAEYFVAWFVLEKLQNENVWKAELSNFVFKTVIRCQKDKYDFPSVLTGNVSNSEVFLWRFSNPVLCYFLSSFIGELHVKSLPSLSSDELLSFDIMQGIAYTCLDTRFVKIFIFFDDVKAFDNHSQQLFDSHFLIETLNWSNVEMLKRAFMHFDQSHKFDLELQLKVLRAALEIGRFSVVEFLLKEKELRGIVKELKDGGTMELLHYCVTDSLFNSNKVIGEKVLILQMLVDINSDLLEAKDKTGRSPLLCSSVNVQLLKELIRLGANVFAHDMENSTVIHSNHFRSHLPQTDYHSLLISIPAEKMEKLVHVKRVYGYTPLTSQLRQVEPIPDTLHTFHKFGANFNAIDDKGYSVLAVAVRHGRRSETIRTLVNLGAKLSWRGKAKRETLLHHAAKYGNVEAVEILLQKQEFDVNVMDEDGLTSLDYAIRSEKGNRLETGLALIKRGGTFVEVADSERTSLLHICAKSLNSKSVKLLLLLGVDVNTFDEQGNAPLHLITAKNKNDPFKNAFTITELLLQQGADPTAVNMNGETPFHIALRDMSLDRFELLKSKSEVPWSPSLANLALNFIITTHCSLDEEKFRYFARECEAQGADFNFVNEEGDSFLHIVVKSIDNIFSLYIHSRNLLFLMKNDANPNLKNKLGRTPLHLAALFPEKNLSRRMIMILIEMGADTHARDNRGFSFIQYFVEGSPLPSDFHLLVEHLSSKGHADLFSCADVQVANLLHLAVMYLEPEEKTLSLLQSNSVDFNAVDKLGASVLLYAIQFRRSVVFLSTLVNKFGVNWKRYKRVLLHNAGQFGTLDCLRFLLDLGGLDVNGVSGASGDTPLHSVVQQDEKKHLLEKCKLLIERGADPYALNKNRQTPLGTLVDRQYESPEDPLPEDSLPPLQLTDGEIDELFQLLTPSQNPVSSQTTENGCKNSRQPKIHPSRDP